jgi:hypothetical protein
MTGSAPSLAIQVDERAEAPWLTADYGHYQRKSKHARTSERFGRAADTDPNGQRILQRARVDYLAGKRGAVFAGPVCLRARPDS